MLPNRIFYLEGLIFFRLLATEDGILEDGRLEDGILEDPKIILIRKKLIQKYN